MNHKQMVEHKPYIFSVINFHLMLLDLLRFVCRNTHCLSLSLLLLHLFLNALDRPEVLDRLDVQFCVIQMNVQSEQE